MRSVVNSSLPIWMVLPRARLTPVGLWSLAMKEHLEEKHDAIPPSQCQEYSETFEKTMESPTDLDKPTTSP
jgi:hypothetical protein